MTSEIGVNSPFSAGDLEELPPDTWALEAVKDQLAAIKKYLSGNRTVDECSKDLLETIPKAIADGSKADEDSDGEDGVDIVSDAVYTLINTLQHIAMVNSAHQPAMLALLQTIQRRSPQKVHVPTKRGGLEKKTQDIVWSLMPRFTAHLTDTYEYQQYLFLKTPSSESAILRWASVNAWIARLVSTENQALGGAVFYMHRASYRFLRVLDVEDHPDFLGEVPAAANLFRYASPVLLELCREEPPFPVPPNNVIVGIFDKKALEYSEGKKVLWSKPGYSMSRWAWWKVRWGQLAVGSDFDDNVKGHAKDALTAMAMAEE